MCVLSHVRLFVTPRTANPPGSSVYGNALARILERFAISYSRGSSWSRDRPVSPAVISRCFTAVPPGRPILLIEQKQIFRFHWQGFWFRKQECSLGVCIFMYHQVTLELEIKKLSCRKWGIKSISGVLNRKRWEYQTTWPASWETCMQVRKQQLELDMEQQTGSK